MNRLAALTHLRKLWWIWQTAVRALFRWMFCQGRVARGVGAGQSHHERAAMASAGALRRDRPIVHLDKLFRKREPDAQAAICPIQPQVISDNSCFQQFVFPEMNCCGIAVPVRSGGVSRFF